MHHWSEDDDLIGYCLYRFGNDVFGRDRHELGDALGMGFNSLALKVANFKAIDGLGGMEQYSQQALRVANRYRDQEDAEVLAAGRAALQRASHGTTVSQTGATPTRSAEEQNKDRARAQRQIAKLQAQIEQLQKRIDAEA